MNSGTVKLNSESLFFADLCHNWALLFCLLMLYNALHKWAEAIGGSEQDDKCVCAFLSFVVDCLLLATHHAVDVSASYIIEI